MLAVTVEAGSVILTVVATDTAGGASEVETAAVALQTKPLDAMSRALGVTVEEAPAAPSVRDVLVRVPRLAPSPPPPSGADQRAATMKKRLAVGLVGAAMSVVGAIALLCAWRRRVRASRASLPRSPRPGPPHAPQSHVTVEGNPLAPPPKTPLVVEAVALDEDEAPPAYGVVVSQGMAVV